jgi:ferredoxin-NADP reductase
LLPVLLAGGIGITPFRSIVVAAAKEKLPHRIFLFYSNRRPEDAPFLEELQALEAVNPNYLGVTKVIPMVSGPFYIDFRDRCLGRAKWKSEIPG